MCDKVERSIATVAPSASARIRRPTRINRPEMSLVVMASGMAIVDLDFVTSWRVVETLLVGVENTDRRLLDAHGQWRLARR
jgi:hypothetical protein